MGRTIDLAVPDLGGFENVPVITVLVQPGDTIAKNAPLVELESDKATMEVPAEAAGTVRDVKVRIGDKVSQGAVIVRLEVADDAAVAPATPVDAAAAATATAPPAQPDEAPEHSRPDDARADGSTMTDLVVPDLGGFHDVPVIAVLVREGDTIAKDAPLVELESEKATMEIPAASGGIVHSLRVRVGDRVSAGSLLGTLRSNVGVPAPPPPAAPERPRADPAIAAPVLAAVVAPAPPSRNGSASNGHADGAGSTGIVHASPAIRRFARELGVELSGVRGSGPNGRITRDDVQGFVKTALAAGPASPHAGGGLTLALPPWPVVDFAAFGPIERKPLSRIQKFSGPNLARNWVSIPHVTQNDDADVTELDAFRRTVNAEQRDVKVTLLAFLIKACVSALQRFPEFNSSLDGDELVLKRYYHIGFAADTPSGLVVPVVRDADRKGILAIAGETADLAAKAREGKLRAGDMNGGTFSISSLGGIGGTSFTPIVNAPEVAILGASRTAVRPVWDGTAFVPRTILPLSLSYDHRVIDGASAARFTAYLASVITDLRKTLL